VNGCDMSGV